MKTSMYGGALLVVAGCGGGGPDGPSYMSDVYATGRALGDGSASTFRQVVLTAEVGQDSLGGVRFLDGAPAFDALGQLARFEGHEVVEVDVRLQRDEDASGGEREVFDLVTDDPAWRGRLALAIEPARGRRDLIIDMGSAAGVDRREAQIVSLFGETDPDLASPRAEPRYGVHDVATFVGRDRTWTRDSAWAAADAAAGAEPIPVVYLGEDGRGWVMLDRNQSSFDAAGRLTARTLVRHPRLGGDFVEDSAVQPGGQGEQLLRFAADSPDALPEDISLSVVTSADGSPVRLLVERAGVLDEIWPLAEAPARGRRAPAGELVLESAQVTGGRAASAVGTVVEQGLHRLRYCFTRALDEQPSQATAWTVSLEIAADGSPRDVQVAEDGADREAFASCVKRRFERMRFGPSDADEVAQVTQQLVWSPTP